MQKMAPITTERPKVLLPLVNSPMIEYILEWLATSGVVMVHILACSHADLLKQYLATSAKWADSELEINIISSYNCMSAGEALRLVDQEQIIKDDFILVSGDVVTNMNLQAALGAHKKRRWEPILLLRECESATPVCSCQVVWLPMLNVPRRICRMNLPCCCFQGGVTGVLGGCCLRACSLPSLSSRFPLRMNLRCNASIVRLL